MNEEIAKEVLRWLSGIRDVAETQAPQLAADIVRYGIAWNLIAGATFIAATVGAVKLGLKANRLVDGQTNHDLDPRPIILEVVGWFGALVFGAIAFAVVSDAAQAIFAPRLYVLYQLKVLR